MRGGPGRAVRVGLVRLGTRGLPSPVDTLVAVAAAAVLVPRMETSVGQAVREFTVRNLLADKPLQGGNLRVKALWAFSRIR